MNDGADNTAGESAPPLQSLPPLESFEPSSLAAYVPTRVEPTETAAQPSTPVLEAAPAQPEPSVPSAARLDHVDASGMTEAAHLKIMGAPSPVEEVQVPYLHERPYPLNNLALFGAIQRLGVLCDVLLVRYDSDSQAVLIDFPTLSTGFIVPDNHPKQAEMVGLAREFTPSRDASGFENCDRVNPDNEDWKMLCGSNSGAIVRRAPKGAWTSVIDNLRSIITSELCS